MGPWPCWLKPFWLMPFGVSFLLRCRAHLLSCAAFMALREALEAIASVVLPSSVRKAFGVVHSSGDRPEVRLLGQQQELFEVVAHGSGGPLAQARRCRGSVPMGLHSSRAACACPSAAETRQIRTCTGSSPRLGPRA